MYDNKNNPMINLVDLEYYNRLLVIEYLDKLEEEANNGRINWLNHNEFFKRVGNFAGEGISKLIYDQFLGKKTNSDEKVDDKNYITLYKELLLKKDQVENEMKNKTTSPL